MATTYPTVTGVTFKDTLGFPGYCVGDDGSVWSRKGRGKHKHLVETWRELKPWVSSGYPAVTLCDGKNRVRKERIHVLVLEAFVGPRPERRESLHRDGNKFNNHIDNLYWGTSSDNSYDAVRHGRLPVGTKHHWARLSEDDVQMIRHMKQQGVHRKDIAERFGISRDHVNSICRRKFWKCVA